MINLQLIDKTERKIIAKRFLPLVEDYFKDEKVQADFKKWQALRNKKLANCKGGANV